MHGGNSGLRRETPDALRAYLDAQPKEKLKDCLHIMNELTNQYGFQAAASAMEMACSRGNIDICDALVLAARITDDQMAAAMIDRLVHHGHLLLFEGTSYRMEHALMRRDA